MKSNYKSWVIEINEPAGMKMYWTWSAVDSKTGKELADYEGGDLGDYSNASNQIKTWIDDFEIGKEIPKELIVV